MNNSGHQKRMLPNADDLNKIDVVENTYSVNGLLDSVNDISLSPLSEKKFSRGVIRVCPISVFRWHNHRNYQRTITIYKGGEN